MKRIIFLSTPASDSWIKRWFLDVAREIETMRVLAPDIMAEEYKSMCERAREKSRTTPRPYLECLREELYNLRFKGEKS